MKKLHVSICWDKMKKDPSVVAITSGTPGVMGFTKSKREEAGKQFVDVGIAEETAVALASGIAANAASLFMEYTAHSCREPLTRFRRICVSIIILRRLLPSWALFMV